MEQHACPDCETGHQLPGADDSLSPHIVCPCGLKLLSGTPDNSPERPYAVLVEPGHWVRYYHEEREAHVYGPGGPVEDGEGFCVECSERTGEKVRVTGSHDHAFLEEAMKALTTRPAISPDVDTPLA